MGERGNEMTSPDRNFLRLPTGGFTLDLPELFGGTIKLVEFDEDLVIHATNFNHLKFNQVLTLIPAFIRRRVIGFVSIQKDSNKKSKRIYRAQSTA